MDRRFRTLLALTLAVSQSMGVFAQRTPVSGGWDQLRTLPEHTRVNVVTDRGKADCTLERVTEEQIVCEGAAYARPEVRSVRLIRHGASTAHGLFIGLGAGVAGGAIVGAALGNSAFSTPGRGAAVGIAIFAPIGAGIGAALGRAGDHASRKIYMR